ncbi:hypothetical protein M5X00_08750 [Paenibacillus alvei]|nr:MULTISPECIES: hypothetical protein [Paenibacillus]EJW18244.1 hypothetical protein PAV_3c06960 [Paenibacillus alvei DSM 29]MCY7485584.1 hypothetical protein [Paenibacillus alvei]MCY9544675.1 hypothetical protein [Paenibacillus alvei]MCY9703729.1 hypothetical protein [Paenibacillus alvei]MCY9732608.1 hypothetical protein [Paenibacillus alvei]
MSMPNIPDIKPEIILKRNEVVNLLLTSIALEEIGLSHIINAEGEKIQAVIKKRELCLSEALKINDSVDRMLRNIVKNQMLLHFKLEDVIRLEKHHHHEHCEHCEDCEE